MANHAWVIDQTSCIGCHACTTACKSENDVPLGVNRTWVKYVERGTFPATRRDIAVLRCNHCEEPPCVEICPTTAMFRRPDGIVDFDTGRCIGCKACLQACPYDAIYIDSHEHVAEKCNFCSHRVDQGLLPACVVVCPTESLLFGDLEDPRSRVAQVVASRPTMVRRPEQATRPNAFYLGATVTALDPLAPVHADAYMWSERRRGGAKDHSAAIAALEAEAPPVRGGARAAYDAFHPEPWGWKVALYLWTKNIGAGVWALAFLAPALGLVALSRELRLAAAFASLAFIGLTTLLLVWDLKRPERFWTILIRPQRRSWLALGSFVLVGYSGLLGLWFLGTWFGADETLLLVLGAPTVVLAALASLYTAFLLAQCEARDLWQNPAVFFVLLAHMTVLGAAGLLVAAAATGGLDTIAGFARAALVGGGVLGVAALLSGEAGAGRTTANARAAGHLLVRGPFRTHFWLGGVLLAGLVPVAVAAPAPTAPAALLVAGLAAAAGALWYEFGFVAAGQAVPIS